MRSTDAASAFLGGGNGRTRVLLVTLVLQELWAGARTAAQRTYVERVHALAWRQGRLLNPTIGEWILSGRALEVLARRGSPGHAGEPARASH